MKPICIEVVRGVIRTRFDAKGVAHGARPEPQNDPFAGLTHRDIELHVVFACSGGADRHTAELRFTSPQYLSETFACLTADTANRAALPLLPIERRRPVADRSRLKRVSPPPHPASQDQPLHRR